MKAKKQKWIYKTIFIDSLDIEKYIAYIKQGYCVFTVKGSAATFLCSEFQYYFEKYGDLDFLYEYAYLLRYKDAYEENDEIEYFQIMTYLSDLGYVKAYYSLSLCYVYGFGVEKDPEKSFFYASKAAEKGYVPAINSVAVSYYLGQGVEQDRKKAYELMVQCADSGHAPSQVNIGLCYFNGEDVEQDYQKAFYYFSLAAAQNYPRGDYLLGKMYLDGLGIEKDFDLGFYHVHKAAKNGYQKAQDLAKQLSCRSQLLYQNNLWYRVDEDDSGY